MSENIETEDLNATAAEVSRIISTGTIWFSAAIVGSALPLSGLLSAGWRPSELPERAATDFWIGVVIAVAGVVALGWAGCPVLGATVHKADRQKVVSIRGGVALYLLGSTVVLLTVLLN